MSDFPIIDHTLIQPTLIDINKKLPVVIVDAGYLYHYRLNATKRWISFQNNQESIDIEDVFKRHLKSQLETLRKKLKIKNQTILFCLDNPLSTLFRKELYPEYKATRCRDSSDNTFIHYNSFKDILIENGICLQIEGLEADDIAAHCVRSILKENESQVIYIITSDHDYLQLKGPSVHLLQGSGKEFEGKHEDPEVCKWMKVFMGDKSDNIPPAIPKCGPKKALEIAADSKLRNESIIKYKESIEINLRLIDFDLIPQKYKTILDSKVKFALN